MIGLIDQRDNLNIKDIASRVVFSYLKISSGSGIRLFLDDVRDPEDYKIQDVLWVKNYKDAVDQLKTGKVTWISFDHDLGEGKSGYDVAKYIEKGVFNGDIPCPEWQIHSSNPKGRRDIEMAMKSAERFKKG